MRPHETDCRATGTRPVFIIIDDVGPAENAATRKIKDMEARVAVEGNTDGNHDNVEAAK